MKEGFEVIEAEQALLGLLFLKPSSVGDVLFLKEDEFAESLHGRIFAEQVEGYSKGVAHTPFTLARKFDNDPALKDLGGSAYLTKLAKSGTVIDHAPDLAAEIRQCAMKRRLWDLCSETAAELESSENSRLDPDEFLARLSDGIGALQDGYTEKAARTSKEVAADMVEGFKVKPKIYKTNLAPLDTAMGGGMMKGRAYGVAARKKAGKTALLSTIAQNLNKQGIKVLYVALEMGREQIMQRIIAREIGVNPILFVTEKREERGFQQKVAEFHNKDRANLSFLDFAGIDINRLKMMLTGYVRRRGFDVVIIDYWQLIKGKHGRQSMAEHLDDVAQWIAEFSKREGVATLTASQLNQDGNTRGGEGMRLAFDQVYQMNLCEHIEGGVWLNMMDTRYTPWMDIGDANHPAFMLNPKGVFFEEAI